MTTVTRHAGAPYVNGETLQGPDLETDISNIVSVVNGSIDNANIATAAAIAGSKLADASIATAKIQDGAITGVKLAANVATNLQVTGVTTAQVNITGTSYADIGDSVSVAITSASGQTPKVLIVYMASFIADAAPDPGEGMALRFTRDNVAMSSGEYGAGGTLTVDTSRRMWAFAVVDSAPTSGATHVYRVQGLRANVGTPNFGVANRIMFALECRR